MFHGAFSVSVPVAGLLFLAAGCGGHLVVVVHGRYDDALELALACSSGDEVTADDVLLQTLEGVDFAADGSFAEYLGGLLEGGC